MTGRAQAQSQPVDRRTALLHEQHPFAAVLACADSRVPPEMVFDQGLGELFVVRTAGHVVDDAVLGSLDYAINGLGVDLLLVLGHEGCGAIAATQAALAGGPPPPGHVRGIVDRLAQDVALAGDHGAATSSEFAQWRAAATVEDLLRRSHVLREATFAATAGIVAATYTMDSGRVEAVGVLRPAAGTRCGFDVQQLATASLLS